MSALPDRSAEPRMKDYDAEKRELPARGPGALQPGARHRRALGGRGAGRPRARLARRRRASVVAEQTGADLARESRRRPRGPCSTLGIGKGDRVFVMLPRVPAWYAAMLGAIRIGAVVDARHRTMLTPRDIALPDRRRRRRRGDHRRQRAPRRLDAIDGAARQPAPADRLGRRRRGLAGLRRAAATPPATARRRPTPTARRRPDAPLLHQRHGQLPEDGPAPRVLRARPRRRPRASGTTCGRATGTGRSPTPAGRRPPGAGSSASGTSARRSSRWRSASPTPTRSSAILASAEITSFCAPPTLYRLLVQADLSRARPVRRCATARAPASRSTRR